MVVNIFHPGQEPLSRGGGGVPRRWRDGLHQYSITRIRCCGIQQANGTIRKRAAAALGQQQPGPPYSLSWHGRGRGRGGVPAAPTGANVWGRGNYLREEPAHGHPVLVRPLHSEERARRVSGKECLRPPLVLARFLLPALSRRGCVSTPPKLFGCCAGAARTRWKVPWGVGAFFFVKKMVDRWLIGVRRARQHWRRVCGAARHFERPAAVGVGPRKVGPRDLVGKGPPQGPHHLGRRVPPLSPRKVK